MSKLRPTLRTGSSLPCMRNGTAYLMILSAVKARCGLVHGALKARGEYCAIGSYFHTNGQTSLPYELIDEVAAVNDSVPTLTERQRKFYVSRWLRWRLAQCGMPGYSKAMKP